MACAGFRSGVPSGAVCRYIPQFAELLRERMLVVPLSPATTRTQLANECVAR
jgi:hypothetical protein